MNIIETKNLNFKYKKNVVLSNVSLEIAKGSIYGYLGSNGSGKTTTIRILLGLLGFYKNVIVCGEPLNSEKQRINSYSKIGSSINPFFMYDHLTIKEHFELLNYYYKKEPKDILQTIDKVGLIKHENKKIKNISSGMKQRLSIGMAIYNEPELLILDEPINGLDPVGIAEIRELLLSINKLGTTIFLSSHILTEIEKTCSHIGILHEGKLLYQGAIKELVSNESNSLENIYLKLISNDQ